MGSLLIDEWLGGAEGIPVRDDASVTLVRDEVRRRGAEVGLDTVAVERMVNAASELARNQVVHARRGAVVVRPVARGAVPGVEIVAADAGPGIADPTEALRGNPRASGGLGVGLSAARRLVDEMDVDVRWGEGTCLWARTFAGPVPRSEVAVVGRAYDGGTVSGDHAVFTRTADRLVLGVIDGLGHGQPARAASDRAVATVQAHLTLGPAEIVQRCDAALAGSRGAVMAVASLELASGAITHAGAGNITTRVYAPGQTDRVLGSAARVLGGSARGGRISDETVAGQPKQVLVVYTDGIVSRPEIADPRALFGQPALVIAHELLVKFGRSYDDALVLVVR